MSIKFGATKSLNVGGMELIPLKTEEGKQVFVKTGKCFSFGGEKHKKFKKSISMSLVLDTESVKILENIVAQCEEHLGRPLSKKAFYRDDDKVRIYPKVKDNTKLYETEGEIDTFKYEGKRRDVKAVLEIGGILLNGDETSLQMKVYEALVKEHVREHVRLVDMDWDTEGTVQKHVKRSSPIRCESPPRKLKYAMLSSPTRGDPFCGGLVCN